MADRVIQALASGDDLQRLLARPGITDVMVTEVARQHRLRVTADGKLAPKTDRDRLPWQLTLAEHSPSQHIRTQAARARAVIQSLAVTLESDLAVREARSARALQQAAVVAWKGVLAAMLQDAEQEVRRLSGLTPREFARERAAELAGPVARVSERRAS